MKKSFQIKNFLVYCYAWLICAVCALSIGCTRESESWKIALDLKGEFTEITPDSTFVDFILNPVFLQVSDDQLVVANNKSEELLCFLDLPQLQGNDFTVRKGSGPSEIPNPSLRNISAVSQDITAVPANMSNQVYMVSGKDHDLDVRSYKLPDGWQYCQRSIFLDSGLIFAQEGTLPMQWALFNNEGKLSWELADSIPASLRRVDCQEGIAKMLVRASIGVASKDAAHFVIAFQKFPEIRIYDRAGTLTQVVNVADGFVSQKYAWFTDAQALNNGFAICINVPEEGDDTRRSYIARIDWNGNPEAIYHLKVPASHFCIDEKSRTIYYTTYGDSDFVYHFSY